MLEDLIRKNRSCRRFYQQHVPELETMKDLVNLARLSASAGNLQPLKYIISCEPKKNAQVFDCLAWAGYLKEWSGPQEGEQPGAYIVILGDSAIAKEFGCDHGIAAQSILLGARNTGLAGCMIGSIRKPELRKILRIDPELKILLVLAIGKPKEDAAIEALGPDGSIKYWRDDKGVHHVPKRNLDDILVGFYA